MKYWMQKSLCRISATSNNGRGLTASTGEIYGDGYGINFNVS